MLTLGYIHHVFDRITKVLRQPRCDAVEQVLHRMGRHRGDQALQGAGGWQHDPRCTQQVLGEGQQRSGRHALGRAFLQLGAKPLLGGGVELTPAKVLADALELGAFGRGPLRVGQEQQRVEAELSRKVVHSLERHAPVVGDEPSGGAECAELDGAAQAVLRAACPQHLGRIVRRQRPAPGQVILGDRRHELARATRQGPAGAFL